MTLKTRPFMVGIFFLAVAGFFFVQSLRYDLGTALEMGPAYFPRAVSFALGATGIAMMAGALRRSSFGEAAELLNLRALVSVTGGIVLFAMLLRPAGLVAAMVVMVFTARLSSRNFSMLGSIVLGLVLAALCAGIFVFGLNVRIPLWPGILS